MSLTEEQLKKHSERAGRPSKAFLAGLRPAGEGDYAALEKAAVQALVAGSTHIVITVPNTFVAPAEWGSKKMLTRTKTSVRVQYNASRVLQWLNANGHSTITSEDIRRAKIRFTMDKGAFIDDLDAI